MIDSTIQKIAEVTAQIKQLEAIESNLRAQVVEEMKKQELDSYKCEFGTASRTRRSKLIVKDEEGIIEELKRRKLKDCYETKTSLTKKFTQYVEEGELQLDGVELVTTESLMVRIAQ